VKFKICQEFKISGSNSIKTVDGIKGVKVSYLPPTRKCKESKRMKEYHIYCKYQPKESLFRHEYQNK
jgi:hypothetical protein